MMKDKYKDQLFCIKLFKCLCITNIYQIYLPFEPKRTFGKINEKDEARNGSSAVKQQTKQENYRNRNKNQFVSTFICSLQSSQRKYLYFPNRANKKIAKISSKKMFVTKIIFPSFQLEIHILLQTYYKMDMTKLYLIAGKLYISQNNKTSKT